MVDVVSGGGFFRLTGTDVVSQTLALPPPLSGQHVADTQNVDAGARHRNAYAYAHLRPLGRSISRRGGADAEKRNYDDRAAQPQMGVTWSPFAGTTLRASAFRVLQRTPSPTRRSEPTRWRVHQF
jgi:hypothetical protein